MTQRIFRSIFLVALAVMLSVSVLIMGMMYRYTSMETRKELSREAEYIALGIQNEGVAYFDYLEKVHLTDSRITWIGTDGSVLFDSIAEEGTMENHGDREEVQEAFRTGHGEGERYSATLSEKTWYCAVRLDDGSVLRISVSRATALVLVLGMLQPIAIVLVIAIALSAWLAHRMAKRVVEPLNKLNLEKPMENEAYEELSPLLHRIHAQHKEIKFQMQTLKRKQDEFEQITGNMKEALVLLDNTGRIVSINPAAKALFGAGSTCVGEDFLTIDRKQNMRMALEEANSQGHADFRTKKNGREYQFDLSRIDSDGKNHGMVILAFDITEQVNAEKHRQEFTANVSHELKTPLTSISGIAEIMQSGMVGAEDVPHFAGNIYKESQRLIALVGDIMKISQLDENQVQLEEEPVDLAQVAAEELERARYAAEQRAIQLRLQVPREDGRQPVVTGVRQILQEMVFNLIDNAIKYNVPGGSVMIHAENNRLVVSDTGIGIPAEHKDRIFERFYRVDKSHSKASGGTGLGLSIVKHAAAYHNAEISLESVPGKGTIITIQF